MMPSISVITLAVEDLERAVRFYRDGLGWPTPGIVGGGLANAQVAFFDMGGGMKLALWPTASLMAETGWTTSSNATFGAAQHLSPGSSVHAPVPRTLLSHNVSEAAQVEQVLQRALHAGARCIRAPYAPVWGGRVAFFSDLDGHLWEVAWNPGFQGAFS